MGAPNPLRKAFEEYMEAVHWHEFGYEPDEKVDEAWKEFERLLIDTARKA